MIVSKFGNFEDFFKFLESKRDEIQTEFEKQLENDSKDDQEHEKKYDNEHILTDLAITSSQISEIMTIDKEIIEQEDFNISIVQETPKVKSVTSLHDEEALQKAWSTSLETPSRNEATDTTIIMEKLELNEFEIGMDDYEFELDQDDSLRIIEDPLGLDSLAFPMSQFPGSETNSLELFDNLISEFDTSYPDDGDIDNKMEEAEFDLDISASQFPSTQIAMQSVINEGDAVDSVDAKDSLITVDQGYSKDKEVPNDDHVFIGFKTGRGVSMAPPSKEAMKRARSLVESDELESNYNKKNETGNGQKIPMIPMFTTAKGKAMAPPSKEAMKRARSLVELESNYNKENETENGQDIPMIPMFTTAKGKTIPAPTEEAMKRARRIIETEIETALFETSRDNNVKESIPIPTFSTAKGKTLTPPSKEALDRAQKLVGEIDPVISPQKTAGFSTGRGKALKPPSEEALKRAQELVGDTESINLPKRKIVDTIVKKPLVPGNSAFKPPSRISDNLNNNTLKVPVNLPQKPFSLSNSWKKPRPRPVPAKIKQAPPIVQLFDLNIDGIKRFKLKDFFKTPPNLSMSFEEYQSYGISREILEMNSVKAKEYRFSGDWGPGEAHKYLIENGAQSVSISETWTENHYRWIIWKFASFIRAFPDKYSIDNLSPSWVLSQLLYRYEREVHLCQRSALKKIVERDDAAGKHLCLLIARIDSDLKCFELSDGWYSIWTNKLDSSFWELVENGVIREGIKIEISGALLTGQEAIPALEASSPACQSRLTISRNSCRPGKWDTKLGFIKSVAFLKNLNNVHDCGGLVPAIRVIIDRIYPILYREERDTGSNTSSCLFKRNERDHYLYLESNAEQAQTSKFTLLQRIKVRGPKDSQAIISFWNPLGEDQRALLSEGNSIIITNLRAKTGTKIKSLVSSKSTRIFKDSFADNCGPVLVNNSHVVINLGKFDGFKDLTVNDSFDVSGLSLGRSGNYFWLGWSNFDEKDVNDFNGKYLACITHFTAHLGPGEVVNFRDLCFNHFDCREGVAHFSFTEYSDFKRIVTSGNTNHYNESLARFKHLTQNTL